MEPLERKKWTQSARPGAGLQPAWPAQKLAAIDPETAKQRAALEKNGLAPALGRPGEPVGRAGARGLRPAPGLGRRASTRVGREAARAVRPRPGQGPARPASQFFFSFLFYKFLSKKCFEREMQ